MDRCEHNDKIVKFCASECCVWKDSGGCLTCIKKYHSHMGPAIFVQEKDIEAVLRKYKADSSVKPKVKHLDEYIHNYFNGLRVQLMNFLDELDKKVRMELCYPYLSRHGLAGAYKKLKKKEYRKVSQKEFRQFYQATQKLSMQEYNQEERFLYDQAVRKHQKLLSLVFETANNLQNRLNTIDQTVQCKLDTTLEVKIQNVFDMISSGRGTAIVSDEAIGEQEKSLTQLVPPTVPLANPNLNLLRVPSMDGGHSRRKSIEASMMESQQVTAFATEHTHQSSDYSKKERQLSQMKRKLLTMMASNKPKEQSTLSHVQSAKNKFETNRSVEHYRIIEPKKESPKKQSPKRETPKKDSPKKEAPQQLMKLPTLNTSLNETGKGARNTLTVEEPKNSASNKSINLTDNLLKIPLVNKISEISEIKHNKLPSQETEQALLESEKKPASPRRNVRAVVIPVKADIKIEPNDYSPILKRKQTEISKAETGLTLKPVPEEMSPVTPKPQKKPEPEPQSDKPQHKLSTGQQSSVELLTESLKRSTEEAIPLLQRALALAPNNISAAEYLSFLLLEKSHAMQCIKVCNNILEQLEGEALYDANSIHVHTNKAVALIMMGRYSEAVPVLERCLQIKESDRLYKNLADAFFLLGIPEKAVYNYEKALSMNGKSSQAHYNLAVCLYTQENYNNALLYVEKALNLAPANEEYRELRQQTKLKI